MDNVDNVVENWKKIGLTVWDIILSSLELSGLEDKSNWCDVESAIANWVKPRQQINKIRDIFDSNKYINEDKSDLWTTLPNLDLLNEALERNIVNNNKTVYQPHTLENLLYAIFSEGYTYYLYEYMKYLKKYYSSDSAETPNETTSNMFILLEELYALEREFQSYLTKEVKYHCNKEIDPYDSLLITNITRLINEDISELQVKPVSILNFNYTGIYGLLSDHMNQPAKQIKIEINVHGRLDKEIIFGIDGSEHLSDPNIAPFTKTYRVMDMDTIVQYRLNENMEITKQNKILQDFDVIKFFGHSLAKADYSYFQSIFDFVNLYSGHTHLIFYYTKHDNKSAQEVRTETLNRVTNLLTDYGNTLDNKDHGKNLIHKLLLEGRLSITKY